MKILLIRHGEQEYPYDRQGRKIVSGPEAPLVEFGRKQMYQLGKQLIEADITLDAIYTSPYPRAQQSADILAREQYHVHIVDDLKDDFPNSAEGKTYEELEKRGGDIYAHPFSGDQESLDHLVQRARMAITFILSDAKEHGYETVAIVGHGDPLCALDWSIKHQNTPSSYDEMKNEFYPQKGEACEYTISDEEPFRLIGEGRIITTEAAKQTIEGFRSSSQKETD